VIEIKTDIAIPASLLPRLPIATASTWHSKA